MTGRHFFLTLFCCLLFSMPMNQFAARAPKLDRSYVLLARKYGFDIPKKNILGGQMSGKELGHEELEDELDRFFKLLEVLPPGFVRRTNLKTVMVYSNLKLNGKPCGGAAGGGVIYLNAGFIGHVIYHEMFHTCDPKRENRRWTALNPKKFVYTGSSFYKADLSKRAAKQVKKNKKEKPFEDDFISEYGQSFEFEDRAETFAAMISEGRDFLKRVEKSPVMKKKMDFIIALTSNDRFLGPDYWAKRLKEPPVAGPNLQTLVKKKK